MGDIRVSGLESAIDIQDTITKLVEAQRYRITSYEAEQEEVSYDLQAWNELETLAIDLTDSLDTLRSWETWNEMTATSSDESTLTATASSSAVNTSYRIEINQLATSQNVAGTKASDLTVGGTAETDLVAAGVLAAGSSFNIEGQTITIGSEETLNTLVGKINTAGEAMSDDTQVQASILGDQLVIMRKETGAAEMSMSDIGGTPLENLGVLNSSGGYVHELVAAQDADFTVNGASITRSSNEGLDDVITGVTLNLLQETAGTPVILDIDNDTEDAKAAVLDFVEKYNTFAEQMRYYTQIPLTGDSTGDGAQIEALGELYNDSLAKDIEGKMRAYATKSEYPYLNQVNAGYTYNGNEGVCDSLEDIGIWTSGQSNSISVTDEDRLDQMLDSNFELVGQLFRGIYDEDSDDGYVHGVASDFYAYMDNVSSSITGEIASRIGSLEDEITQFDTEIATEEESLAAYEERLITQFTNMESAEAEMNYQLKWLEQQGYA